MRAVGVGKRRERERNAEGGIDEKEDGLGFISSESSFQWTNS